MTPRERSELCFAAHLAAGGNKYLAALLAGIDRSESLDELEAELRERWPQLFDPADTDTTATLLLLSGAMSIQGQAELQTDEARAKIDREAETFLGVLELRRRMASTLN